MTKAEVLKRRHDALPDWMRRKVSGFADSYGRYSVLEEHKGYATVIWHSSNYWAGIGQPQAYHETSYWLYQMDGDDRAWREEIQDHGQLTNELRARLHKILVEDREQCAASSTTIVGRSSFSHDCYNAGKIREAPGRSPGLSYYRKGFEDIHRWVCGVHSLARKRAEAKARQDEEQAKRDRSHSEYLLQSHPQRNMVESVGNMLAWLGRDPPPYGHDCDWCGECTERALVDLKAAHVILETVVRHADESAEKRRQGRW